MMIEESIYLESFADRPYPIESDHSFADRFAHIPRGNTCPGVNRLIIRRLVQYFEHRRFRILDAPCGTGVFLEAVSRILPRAELHGCDVVEPDRRSSFQFSQADLQKGAPMDQDSKFDAITCISGVMEFDNTLAFLSGLRNSITSGGLLLVTNDNLLTVRDRLMYLLQGRFGQYPFDVDRGTSTWKVIPLQNLIRLLREAGFELETIEYTSPSAGSWCWLPLALPLHLLQKIMASKLVQYLPLKGLMSRHYVLVCRPV
ncbi:MAG: methyltransferase domain-containing protein [Pyrinomonadaceae bacterium]